MSTDTLKTQICDALAAFIRQRPGLDWRNYYSNYDRGEHLSNGMRAYRTEQRSIARDKRDAETLLQAVRWRDGITAEALQEAFKRAFSGRLTVTLSLGHQYEPAQQPPKSTSVCYHCGELRNAHDVRLEYCTGQYWPTEYRRAAAAVCASALWEYTREHAMPKGELVHNSETGATFERYKGLHGGDWLRQHFRKEFGSKIQRRWFN